jgi:vacuolar iron transporter family protein
MTFFEKLNPHAEAHRGEHAGWLRAAVLGANDGLVSTASLMVGVAASGAACMRCS